MLGISGEKKTTLTMERGDEWRKIIGHVQTL